MATKTANARLSTYSTAPTLAPSFAPSRLSTISKVSDTSYLSVKSDATSNTTTTTNPKHIDISVWHRSFEKLRDERLEQQRFYITEVKKDEQGKLALGAKLERALSRRMTGQDYVRRERKPQNLSPFV